MSIILPSNNDHSINENNTFVITSNIGRTLYGILFILTFGLSGILLSNYVEIHTDDSDDEDF